MSVVGFCMFRTYWGQFSHGTQPPSNGPGTPLILSLEAPQNTSHAAKFNQAPSPHSNPRGKVPAQGFEAETALPDAYPSVHETGHFDAAQQEYGYGVSLSKWLEQRELFVKVFARPYQHQLSVLTDLMVAFELEAFRKGS